MTSTRPHILSAKDFVSPTPSALANECSLLSKLSVGDLRTDQLAQEQLGLKPRDLSKDAWLGSGGEDNLAANDVAFDDRIECENFFCFVVIRLNLLVGEP